MKRSNFQVPAIRILGQTWSMGSLSAQFKVKVQYDGMLLVSVSGNNSICWLPQRLRALCQELVDHSSEFH